MSQLESRMSNQDKHKVVNLIIGICLGYLVETDFVEQEWINGKWYSRYDMNERLQNLQFVAAASIDDIGRPVVVFNMSHNIKAIAWGMAHEAIHLAQICKGDWEPFQGYSVWKGKEYKNLPATDVNYFSIDHQPWEVEAKGLEEKVRQAIYEKLPLLKSS